MSFPIEDARFIKETVFEILDRAERTYGVIHDSIPAEINGEKGFLIWDYILYNELTFLNQGGKITSLYTSISDDKMKAKFDEYKEKYGL